MGYAALWRGLERQIDTPAAAALFHGARARHQALARCESLHAVVRSRVADAVLGALVAEYARSRHSAWAAAVALAMKGMLIPLARKIERGGTESDSTSMVLLALLEVAARPGAPKRRLALRLYSETRRRVVRAAIAECRRRASRTTDDVDAIVPDGGSRDVETVFDRARFVRTLAARPPRPDESVARYIARLRRRPRDLSPELAHHRRQQLDDLRDALTRAG
jgi:hypothetical protein